MADEQLRGLQVSGQEARGIHQILHVAGEMRRAKISLALPQAGEIEAQHGDPLARQRLGDIHRCPDVLGAGEAMREQCASPEVPGVRPVHYPCQSFAA